MFGKPKNSPSESKAPGDLDEAFPDVADLVEPVAEPPARANGAAAPRRDNPITSVLASQKPSVISEGFSITGDIQSTGILHVEGRISGTVAAQSVNISTKGEVEGEIRCNSLNIKGMFRGMADCDELVVASSANVQGTILYRFITIGSGAMVQGELAVKG
jgi:cytoskeletal protein CcmA (bactofilin family)